MQVEFAVVRVTMGDIMRHYLGADTNSHRE